MNNNNNHSMHQRSKGAYRFNFVDLILVLLCIAIVAGCAYIFSPNFKIDLFNKKEAVTIQYVVEIKGVDEEFVEMIKENNTVIDSVSKNELGTVVAIDQSAKYSELSHTKIEDNYVGVLVDHPTKYNLIVTISANGEFENEVGYSVNTRRIAVGEQLNLKFPNFTCECYCIALSIV